FCFGYGSASTPSTCARSTTSGGTVGDVSAVRCRLRRPDHTPRRGGSAGPASRLSGDSALERARLPAHLAVGAIAVFHRPASSRTIFLGRRSERRLYRPQHVRGVHHER